MENKKPKKIRLNLYLKEEIVSFAKKWSYVTKIPISKMLEEYLEHQMETVSQTTPFQWLSDPNINPVEAEDDKFLSDLDAYMSNKEEEEFCQQNPDHPRAKIRQKILKEYEKKFKEKMELRKQRERELIQRWMEVFN